MKISRIKIATILVLFPLFVSAFVDPGAGSLRWIILSTIERTAGIVIPLLFSALFLLLGRSSFVKKFLPVLFISISLVPIVALSYLDMDRLLILILFYAMVVVLFGASLFKFWKREERFVKFLLILGILAYIFAAAAQYLLGPSI